ncbi:MAG: terminase small subunit [Clostridia bacterium]|nr:terminase small subunit [Clostridia bacterium]
MPTAYKKRFVEFTEEELLNMDRQEATLELTERERLFCENFIGNHNAILAAKKAGYTGASANSMAYRLLNKDRVNLYIAWLKLRISQQSHISALDIIDHYARIAFSNVTDFVKISGNKVELIDAEKIDGQLVKSVKKGRDGISIELYDKIAALQKLERYFDVMPKDWKEKIEEKKLALMEQRLEIERLKAGQGGGEIEDDGFIEALKGTAEEVWGDEKDDDWD